MCFFYLLQVGMCENRQQPTWILVKKVAKRWCTCVCAPHFFFAALFIKVDIQNSSATSTNKIYRAELTTQCLFVDFCFVCCARIDNNRREYCKEKLRKMVCMRVCSAFFFRCALLLSLFWKMITHARQNKKIRVVNNKHLVFVLSFLMGVVRE